MQLLFERMVQGSPRELDCIRRAYLVGRLCAGVGFQLHELVARVVHIFGARHIDGRHHIWVVSTDAIDEQVVARLQMVAQCLQRRDPSAGRVPKARNAQTQQPRQLASISQQTQHTTGPSATTALTVRLRHVIQQKEQLWPAIFSTTCRSPPW